MNCGQKMPIEATLKLECLRIAFGNVKKAEKAWEFLGFKEADHEECGCKDGAEKRKAQLAEMVSPLGISLSQLALTPVDSFQAGRGLGDYVIYSGLLKVFGLRIGMRGEEIAHWIQHG